MRRELIVRPTDGSSDWKHLDLGDESPAMVFQISDLNDLSGRNASYSQALALPITPHNCQVFGYANLFEVRSAAPYQSLECRWYEEGFEVIGAGYRLCILEVSDVFECQIYSAMGDLFGTLKGKAMTDLTTIPSVVWSDDVVKATLDADAPDKLLTFAPPLFYQRAPGNYTNDSPGGAAGQVMVAGMQPYMRLVPLVRTILAETGYTLETDVDTAPGYDPILVSLADLVPGEIAFYPLMGAVGGRENPGGGPYPQDLLDVVTDSSFNYGEVREISIRDIEQTGEGEIVYRKAFEYTSPGAAAIQLKMSCGTDSITPVDDRVRYRVQKFGNKYPAPDPAPGALYEQEVIFEKLLPAGVENAVTTELIELAPGERIAIEIALASSSTTGVHYYGGFQVLFPIGSNAVPAGGEIEPKRCTDFKDQLEPVRLFLQLYAAIIAIDEERKVLKAYTLNRYFDRATAGDYADWSGKLDRRQNRDTAFKVGAYARINRVLLAASDLDGSQQVGVIAVNNANLEATKDLITLGATSSINRTAAPPIASPATNAIDVDVRYTQDDGVAWDYSLTPNGYGWPVPLVKYRKGKTHLVRLASANTTNTASPARLTFVMTPNPSKTPVYTLNAKVPYAIDLQAVVVESYYATLRDRVLNNARMVTATFNLTPLDIANLDLFKPVYVEEFGQFFYIQKISNYVPRRLTEVTLVCINS